MSDQNGKKQTGTRGTLNRRDVLRNASALAGLGLLASCAPPGQPTGDSSPPAPAAGAVKGLEASGRTSFSFRAGNGE